MANNGNKYAVVNATLYWAALDRVNELSEKFQVDCGELSDADVEKLRTIGLEPHLCDKEETNRGMFITVKSSVKSEEWRRGEHDLQWFTVTDEDRMPVDLATVGNGTKARVKIDAIPYTFKKKDGIAAGLGKIVVTELVEFEGNGGEGDDELYS